MSKYVELLSLWSFFTGTLKSTLFCNFKRSVIRVEMVLPLHRDRDRDSFYLVILSWTNYNDIMGLLCGLKL